MNSIKKGTVFLSNTFVCASVYKRCYFVFNGANLYGAPSLLNGLLIISTQKTEFVLQNLNAHKNISNARERFFVTQSRVDAY